MWPDIVDINDFYSSSLGRMTCQLLRRQIRRYWDNTRGMRVLGIGFVNPYLRPFLDEATSVIAAMPSSMGAFGVGYQRLGPGNTCCLADECSLPFLDLSLDRVILVHSFEYTDQVNLMLREIWRVMDDGGRLLIVVPNRRGAWSHTDFTPFGHGRPYSIEQLKSTLRQSLFTPVRDTRALFIPPTRRRYWLAAAPAWEKIGARWFQVFGGVVIMEATKQIYAGNTFNRQHQARNYVPLTGEVTQRTRIISYRNSNHGLGDI
ncbi:MAG: methyltransferase type 11 [Alphaproteobacteria bacterium]|jgi:SAM-dependent methyltransferase|nr:methyltransferase type 11 [Alphaproteobacteria bacterium]PPR12781.1 MAG: hypothetical protein CFH42_01756 [Alphaproteobacteria bacterium MarineAlpha12_Bin1]|tara:strand:- start:24358 stop:25140 length:783 start_codon:yes stop_codon:yes gene_type:complete